MFKRVESKVSGKALCFLEFGVTLQITILAIHPCGWHEHRYREFLELVQHAAPRRGVV